MKVITDEYMKEMMTKTKEYCLVILGPGPRINMVGVEKLVWEHGRRNFELRDKGLLSLVCPVPGRGDVNGVGIFNASPAAVKEIMEGDPAVKAGIFVYDLRTCRSFPGDSLPA
jgi:hypothetical protein